MYRTLHPVAALPAPNLTTSVFAVAPGNNNSVFHGETGFAANCNKIIQVYPAGELDKVLEDLKAGKVRQT